MANRAIINTAILIGWSPDAKCVYSAAIPLADYWDDEHLWDRAEEIKTLKLEKLRGFLFDSTGVLIQEFESTFDTQTGSIQSGWTKHADGTYKKL